MKTSDGVRIRRGATLFYVVGRGFNHCGGRFVQPVAERTVERMTETRVRLSDGGGRGCWRKPHELFSTKRAAQESNPDHGKPWG